MNLTGFALRNTPLVLVIVGALAAFGLSVVTSFPSQEDPPILVREAVVTTYAPGMPPEKVERLITRQIEKALARITERDTIYSYSWQGRSEVHIDVGDQYSELDQIWEDVRNKVIDVAPRLPEGVIGPFVNDDYGDVTVISVALVADGFTLAEMYEVAKGVQDELYLIPGVGRVQFYGVQQETVWIEFSTARVAQLNISPNEIRRALETQNIVLPGGTVDTGRRELIISPSGDIKNLSEIENLAIEIPGTQRVVYLQDIATVTRSYVDPPESPFYYDGEPGILLGITMIDGENVLDVGPRVRSRVEALEASLPIGYSLHIGNYQPTHVERAVSSVQSNLFQTIAIVLVVIVAFLGVRTGLIVGLHIPLTMILTLAGMYVAGIAMQRISLATLIISLGLLVDNGIVVSEEIGKRLFLGEGRMDAAINTGKKLAVPLLISSITTVLMFVPLALAPHSSGEYLRSMSMVIMMSLGLSWLLAMTVTPILCHRFLKAPEVSQEEIERQFETPMYRGYRSLLTSALRHRLPFLAAMVGALLGGFGLLSIVPQQFFPESDRPQILVDIKLPAGYGIRETQRQVERLVEWLENEEQNPEIVQTLTYVGSGGVRFFVTIAPEASAENVAAIVIAVADPSQVAIVMDRLRIHALERFPELSIRAKRMFLGSVETGLIEARLYGLDRDALFAAGKSIESRLAEIPGTINIYNDWENRVTHAVVEVDQNQARRSGVTSLDIASSLTIALSGEEFSVLREGDEEIPISARVVAAERLNADRVRGLNVVSAKTGGVVPLMQISTIRPRNEPFVIKRRHHSPTVTVEAKSLTLTAPELEEELRPTLDGIASDLGPEYRWEYGGETESSGDAQTALFAFVPICFLGILICLVGQFNSIKKPIVIILTIPLALAGVSGGLLISGSFYGFMAILGILSLIGIVINNAIVLLDQIDLEQESGSSAYDAIVAASLGRFRPILMTTLTTVLGMLPIIISRDPLFYPMANTIAFGLTFGTVLTLGVAPVLYAVLFRVASPAADSLEA